MTPIARLWPPAVRAAIAEQRAGIDRLLTEDPAPEQTVVLPGPDGSTAVVTQLSAPAATAPPRRRRWIPSAISAATALCVLGAGAWWFVRTDGPMDRYLRNPTCAEAAPKLPLPNQHTKLEDSSFSQETICSWRERDALASDGWSVFPIAEVSWNLRRSSESRSAAVLRKELFAGPAQVSRSETGLAFADEAYWNPSLPKGTCGLSLRTENLIVSVELWDEREAAKIAEAAVNAVPVQDPD